MPSRHNSVGTLSNAVGTCTSSPSFDCCVATAVPWYWLNSIPNIHRAKPYPTTCLDLKVASWAPWPMSSQGGEQTPGLLRRKHKEPCALISRRRRPGSQDRPQQKPSLPTPDSGLAAARTVRNSSLLGGPLRLWYFAMAALTNGSTPLSACFSGCSFSFLRRPAFIQPSLVSAGSHCVCALPLLSFLLWNTAISMALLIYDFHI